MSVASLYAALGRPLSPRGRESRVSCPMPGHADAHPSCRVVDESGVWFCDVCREGGGVRRFAELVADDAQAVELLERHGLRDAPEAEYPYEYEDG